MIGQCFSTSRKKYNILVLAGGAGSRMGAASDYIPKALTKLGNSRAIDHIINRYLLIAEKYIVGVGYYSDLLVHYLGGKYKSMNNIEFSYEQPEQMKNNGYSTIYCLDHADSRCGTIITFCDLLMVGNNEIDGDTVYITSEGTKGHTGTFRHSAYPDEYHLVSITQNNPPIKNTHGVLGVFVCENTPLLKKLAYEKYSDMQDLTWDIIRPYCYYSEVQNIELCDTVFEFGTESDIQKVRTLWEESEK